MSTIPVTPFDGQIFIDFHRVRWEFDAEANCWKRTGTEPDIPVATSEQSGLLSSRLKNLLNNVPEKGGGFGIVVDPKLTLRTEDNPDGVLFGDVKLVSDSLGIDCVFADGKLIPDKCNNAPFAPEIDDLPPGFDINFQEVFLKAICAEIPGGPGPKGDQGDKGEDGLPGTGDGPIGDKGDPGLDATEAATG